MERSAQEGDAVTDAGADMRAHFGAGLLGRLTRALPSRRFQAAHWLGKLIMPRRPFVGRFHSGLLEVHPGEVASLSAFLTGFYEREVTIWCSDLIRTRPPELVVDVGANFGYYPLLFGLLSGGRTRSIAFEPDPTNFAWLSRNVALNPGLSVTAVREAVGDADGGSVRFETAKEGHNLWSRVEGPGANEHAAGIIDVPTTTLDGYLDRGGIADVPLTLIDVEGYEARVVRGMARGIERGRYKTVVVEFHPWRPRPVGRNQSDRGPVPDGRVRRASAPPLRRAEPGQGRAVLPAVEIGAGPRSTDVRRPWFMEHYLFAVEDQPHLGALTPVRVAVNAIPLESAAPRWTRYAVNLLAALPATG